MLLRRDALPLLVSSVYADAWQLAGGKGEPGKDKEPAGAAEATTLSGGTPTQDSLPLAPAPDDQPEAGSRWGFHSQGAGEGVCSC